MDQIFNYRTKESSTLCCLGVKVLLDKIGDPPFESLKSLLTHSNPKFLNRFSNIICVYLLFKYQNLVQEKSCTEWHANIKNSESS